ncbi:glycosyltransferase [Dialister succinatiphilus]|uniref:glycosyltransferase n=1 Tax=Dialister succinatiphilus TaxID=487173 RepID=UPI003AAC7A8C
MKVLHVGEYVQGGVATYIRTLLDHPDYPEIEDYLVCSDYNSDHSWKLPEDRIYYYPYKRTLGNIPNAIKAIYRVVKHVKPDVIYCHSTWAGLFVRLPLFFLPKHCRIIYNAHGWAFLRDTTSLKKALYALIERVLSIRTDAIVNVSDYEYRAAKNARISKKRLWLVFSGISSVKGETPPVELPKGVINLLFVGRFDAPKGIDYLLEHFSKCKRKDIHLFVIGDNVVGDSEKIPMIDTEKVTFCGWIPHDKLDGYYKSCDAVIMPSRWEAFGLVGVEAMKYGKPIIVSNRGALPELVKDGENGYIFDFEHPESLIHILEALNKKELHYKGEKAEVVFWQCYDRRKMLDKTILIYRGGNRN